MSKSKKKNAPGTEYFLSMINHIEQSFESESIPLQMAMGSTLMGMGMRNKALHGPALTVARKMGPIHFDKRGKCDPYDVAKNLTSSYAKKKLGLD